MYHEITYDELQDLLLVNPKLLLLDVRTIPEHDLYALDNDYLLPLDELLDNYDEIEEHKNNDVVIYCKAGIRSAVACRYLSSFGFKHLYNLSGGISQCLRK